MSDGIEVSRDGSVSRITINRPHRRNALDITSMIGLGELIETEVQRPETRVLVLTGAAGAFCSGADLASIDPDPGAPPLSPEVGIRAANRIVKALLLAPVPVIARVSGPAAGVGVPIALAADVAIASDDAYFLLAFTKVGLMPDGGASLLVTAAVGRARALSMALLASQVSAEDAVGYGLIHQAVPAEALDDTVAAVTDLFVAGPRRAFAETKAAVNAAALDLLDRAMDREVDRRAGC